MKKLTNMMIAAAALMVAAGAAQAQQLRVEVPFSFRASGTVMPAGEYRVDKMTSNGTTVFKLTNVDAHRTILALPYVNGGTANPWDASLTFECGSAHCALVELAPGTGMAYRFSRPSLSRDDNPRIAVIRAVLVK